MIVEHTFSSFALYVRAKRAHETAHRVFCFAGSLWYVVGLSWTARRTGHVFTMRLSSIPRHRRSIDDCTPAEWDAASRNTY